MFPVSLSVSAEVFNRMLRSRNFALVLTRNGRVTSGHPSCLKIYFLQDLASVLQVKKILQDSYKKLNSCKILGCNGILARFLQSSCKKLCYITKILQNFSNLQESCKILQEINLLYTHYVLRIYAFHQKASIINH